MTDCRPIVVLSNIIVDDIVMPDGTSRPGVLGGAATYAAVGAASWWPEIAIVAGIGRDLHALAGEQLARLGLRASGLLVRDERTIRARLVYLAGDERTETPVFGLEHFQKMQTTPEDVPEALLPAAGTYFFRDLSPDFWRAFEHRCASLGATLWEWHAGSATPAILAALRSFLPAVDIFSLTLTEARDLLGTHEPHDMINQLLIAGANTIVLRMGAAGALIADRGRRLRVHPPASTVVDVTGAGNSFCGAFLAAWCDKHDLEWAARAAAAAAAQTIAAFGPPERIERATLDALARATVITHVAAIA
jgi:sugar/nucleoside kinase (ribokinase family)